MILPLDSNSNEIPMSYENRIHFLQNKIQEMDLCAALLFYSRDIFYYTGTAQPSFLVVFPEDYFLFVKSGYEFVLDEVFFPEGRIRAERQIENVYKELFSNLPANCKIGTELDILPTTQFYKFKKAFPGYEFVNISPMVLEQRKRKDPLEIDKIKKACEVIDIGNNSVLTTLTEGLTELELAASVENAHRLAGHEGVFFIRRPDFFMSRGPLSSGPNLFKISGVVNTITGVGLSPSVPAGPSTRSIANNDVVIVDIPTLIEGYHADQSRSYVLGKAGKKLKTMYHKLKEIADDIIEDIRPGMKCSDIYKRAMEKSKKLNVAEAFLNFGRGQKARIIGHGIGLEVNEPPILSAYDNSKVSDGFVIALEMHMMDENIGVVKLEDMILVTNTGNEILTKSPRRLFEVQGR